MQYGLPFQAVFSSTDPRIRAKLIRGTLHILVSLILTLLLVGIVGLLILSGYSLRLLRNVQDNQEHPIPEWDQWRDDLRSGFYLLVAEIVWSLPLVILSLAIALLPGIPDSGEVLISLLTTLAFWILNPGITIALAQNGKLTDALRFRTVLDWIVENWLHCLLVSLITILVAIPIMLVSGLIGGLALGIGVLFMVPFGTLMVVVYQCHLLGQLARRSDLAVMLPDQELATQVTQPR